MDPRDRADAVLARAQQRKGVVTPDNMESPMDSADTQVIPSSVVADAEQDPDTTAKVPTSVIERNDESHLSQPAPTVPLATPQADGSAAQSSARTQPLDTPDAPADMTFTGAPVQKPAADQRGDRNEPDSDGFVPTTKVQTTGQSELARRLEGL
ncbi:hypothetical protein [Prauserella rugosa]|uniref:Uncharacterized protein n=1 Tax=Prauserella rugosa TaxID=43354 RepID=A0A660CMV0_9PSEU|nr:hypothetical protein [Prauserella rugosa]TWH22445.1 hypothetical protein JD82_04326 [Prauserella rugosa]